MSLCFVPQREDAMKTTIAPEKKPTLADYEAWKEEQIRLGLEDFEAGRVVSHEEVMAGLDAIIKRYEAKERHEKAA
jgi:predicted transcriptional regulator